MRRFIFLVLVVLIFISSILLGLFFRRTTSYQKENPGITTEESFALPEGKSARLGYFEVSDSGEFLTFVGKLVGYEKKPDKLFIDLETIAKSKTKKQRFEYEEIKGKYYLVKQSKNDFYPESKDVSIEELTIDDLTTKLKNIVGSTVIVSMWINSPEGECNSKFKSSLENLDSGQLECIPLINQIHYND